MDANCLAHPKSGCRYHIAFCKMCKPHLNEFEAETFIAIRIDEFGHEDKVHPKETTVENYEWLVKEII